MAWSLDRLSGTRLEKRIGMRTVSRILACLLCGGASLARGSEPPAELQKLHALLLIDSQAEKVGKSCVIDGQRVESLLRGGIPKNRLSLTILTGKDATGERVIQYYKHLRSSPTDSLLCFYSGHGGTDPEHGPFFGLQNGDTFFRTKLRALIYEHQPSLAVILSDCCSMCLRVPVKRSVVELPGAARQLDPALKSLFFQHRGLVDITGATGNAAWCNEDVGGLFTCNLVKVIRRHSHLMHENREPFAAWKTLFPQVEHECQVMSAEWHDSGPQKNEPQSQKTQKPQAFDVPDDPTRPFLTLHNNSQGIVRYQYRWGHQGTWSSASMPPGGDRLHSVSSAAAAADQVLEVKFDDGESGSLKIGKRYQYSPGSKKRGLNDGDETPSPP